MTQVLDHGYVKEVTHWGSDEEIIEAARMSTGKGFQGWGPRIEHSKPTLEELDRGITQAYRKVDGDEKLLKYLYTHGHMSPFEMCGLIVEVQAPIFVFREWHRHRTQSFNELSGRYSEMPDLYYVPSQERLLAGKQAQKNKQSSCMWTGGEFAEAGQTFYKTPEQLAEQATKNFQVVVDTCRNAYEIMLEWGFAREVARMVLPLNQYSRMRASSNLRNWLGFLSLRLDPAAQWEIRQYAEVVAQILRERFPRTMTLFDAEER